MNCKLIVPDVISEVNVNVKEYVPVDADKDPDETVIPVVVVDTIDVVSSM